MLIVSSHDFESGWKPVEGQGAWTKAEHERFLAAMEVYPKGPWKSIADIVKTRTVRQTQTHAQKYREKLARRQRGLRNKHMIRHEILSALAPKEEAFDVVPLKEEQRLTLSLTNLPASAMPPLSVCLDFLLDALDDKKTGDDAIVAVEEV